MSRMTEEIRERAIKHGSIPFWAWNYELHHDELRRQIQNMKDMDVRGFFMHARTGLVTEYLSEEWYDGVRVCIEEAKKQGLEAWAYDENGWPSGFAGGKLLDDPDNHAVFVEGNIVDGYPENTENIYAIYAFDEMGIPRLTEGKVAGCKKYLCVTVGTDGSYVDTMRADVTDKFLYETHRVYKEKFSKDFGGAMPGFFTDEPQYYRWKTPFSRKMEEWFMTEYGYSVKEALPSLFCDYEGAEEYRYDYHRMTQKKFTENFSKRMYDWAEENGAKITGHFVEERTLRGQMLCCGDMMSQYLYEHIPGIDYLGRAKQNAISSKQLGSVCAQTGRKEAISEMYACCGWDVTPRELKHIAELQYSGGVNLMCQHLYAYTIRGQRKRDYPTFYSEHNLWQKDMKDFNGYFNNLGYILSMGEESADTLVIHPIHSAWLKYKRIEDKTSVADLDADLDSLCDLLSGSGVSYHFGNEEIMKALACVEGDRVRVGLCRYKNVIIPACDTLDSETVELLAEYISNGGKVYTYKHHLPVRIDGRIKDVKIFDGCDDLSDKDVFEAFRNSLDTVFEYPENVTLSDIRIMTRNTDYGRLIYIANISDKDVYGIDVTAKGCLSLGALDIATLDVSAVRGCNVLGDSKVRIDLKGSEAVVLFEKDAPEFLPMAESCPKACIKLENSFVPESLPRNLMALDRASVSLDGGEFSEVRPIERIRDELLQSRFAGKVTLSFPFDVKDVPKELQVITEPMGMDKIKVNGKELSIGEAFAIDRDFRVTDISPFIVEGKNTVEMTFEYYQSDYVYYVLYGGVSESLRNCLAFDTEIECIYLRGSFAVGTDREGFTAEENNAWCYDPSKGMALVKQKPCIDITNIVTDGYPFFCGEITFNTKLNYKKGDPTLLHLTGRYSTASVNVNGRIAGKLVLSEYLDLDGYLAEGENMITLTLCNSYRNLMGPHHYHIAEPVSVSPRVFSFESKWENGECSDFRERYAFVRFGIDI